MSDGWTRLRRRSLRPTRRAWLQLVLGGVLYVAGANVAAGWVVALAGIVVGVVPWAAASAWRGAGRLDVRRIPSDRSVAGAEAEFGIEVRSPSLASVVVCDDLAAAAGTIAGSGRLSARSSVRRGVDPSGNVRAIVSDLFGLALATAEAELPSDLVVLPAVPRASRQELGREDGAEATVRRSTSGTEVIGVREYVRGDPVRHVHWRSTARTGLLVVRELASAGPQGVRVRIAPGIWDRDVLDLACEVACGIAAWHSSDRPAEIAADGSVLPWGLGARRHLATLPPHWGSSARALQESPAAGVTIDIAPAPDGSGIDVGFPDERARIPVGAEVSEWLGGRR